MWAIVKRDGQTAAPAHSWASLEQFWRAGDATVWIDFENPSTEELRLLDLLFDLDDQALEDCLTGEPRPRIDECRDHLLIVAYGVLVPEGCDELESRKLTIFRGERFLVTVHTEPSRSVNALKNRCDKNADALLHLGVDHILYRLIDGMTDRYLSLLDEYEREVEEYEQRAFEPRGDGETLSDAARIRRHLIEIRRLAAAQRELLEPLAEGDFDYLSDELSRKFRGVRNHLLHATDRVEGLQERLTGAVQNYNAMVGARTNDIVRTLTVLTAVMLPMSLVAGVYGMNLSGWPPGDNTASFWAVIGFMTLLGGGMLAWFRWLTWI